MRNVWTASVSVSRALWLKAPVASISTNVRRNLADRLVFVQILQVDFIASARAGMSERRQGWPAKVKKKKIPAWSHV